MSAAYRKIALKTAGRLDDTKVAAAALSPGHLVTLDSNGKYAKHATEGGYAERLFAQEDSLQGRTTADAYAAGEVVRTLIAAPGDEVAALLKAGQNIAVGDYLASAGDGTLKKASALGTGATLKQPIAVAKEAKNLTASGSVATHIAVRIL